MEKTLNIKQLLEEIDKARNENRFITFSIETVFGIILHTSGGFNINEVVIGIEKRNNEETLYIVPRSPSKNRTPSIRMNITDSRNYVIKDCGISHSTNLITDRVALCNLYILETAQTNINGYPINRIRFRIEEKQICEN